MTTRSPLKCLRPAWIVALLSAGPALAVTASLDNPVAGASASGIGIVSGFHCTAGRIDIQIDDGELMRSGQGTTRPDTAAVCGHPDSGFGLTYNWGRLTPGTHTIRALADGVEFARNTFTVAAFGAEFLTGKSAMVTLTDFPALGQGAVLEWREASQSFMLKELTASIPFIGGRWNGTDLESRSSCASPQNNGNHGTYAQFDVDAFESGFNMQQTGVTGLNCTYSATFRQGVLPREASGSYSCTDGKRGDFTAREFKASAHEMSMRLTIQLSGSETCSIDARLGGLRL